MSANDIDQLLVRFISSVELFHNIDLDDVATLLRQSVRIDFEGGELVFAEGDDGQTMYVVTSGEFEVFRNAGGQHVHIATLAPGEHFGEIALLMNRPRSASVRAIRRSSALRLSRQALISEQHAAALLYRNMAQMMAERLVSVENEIILHKTGKYPAFRQ